MEDIRQSYVHLFVDPGYEWREFCHICQKMTDYIWGYANGHMIHCTECEPNARETIHLPENIGRMSHRS